MMINENMKNARKAKGISQEEMAVKLNVVRQTVSKWEKGLSVPDADMLIKISDLLEIPVTDLLGVTPQNNAAADLTNELTRLDAQLAAKNQEESRCLQARKKRGLALFLCFTAMFAAMHTKGGLLSILLSGGCILAASIILYRNLALLTPPATAGAETGTLKVATIFNIAILVLAVFFAALDRAALVSISESAEKLFALAAISSIILFGGFLSPKLPFNGHTGLRLPWTVRDEDTWNVAHKITGYISLPLVLLYFAALSAIHNFKVVSTMVLLLWVGIPGLLSFAFWWKKYHGRL